MGFILYLSWFAEEEFLAEASCTLTALHLPFRARFLKQSQRMSQYEHLRAAHARAALRVQARLGRGRRQRLHDALVSDVGGDVRVNCCQAVVQHHHLRVAVHRPRHKLRRCMRGPRFPLLR